MHDPHLAKIRSAHLLHHVPLTSSLIGPQIVLSILSSNTFSFKWSKMWCHYCLEMYWWHSYWQEGKMLSQTPPRGICRMKQSHFETNLLCESLLLDCHSACNTASRTDKWWLKCNSPSSIVVSACVFVTCNTTQSLWSYIKLRYFSLHLFRPEI
jgi:hypothetical protein